MSLLLAAVGGIGLAVGRLRPLPPRAAAALTRLLTDLLFPALVLRALVREPVSIADAAVLAGGLVAVVLPLAVAAAPLARALGLPYRAVVLPVAFMNSGFLGIPVCRAAGGPAAAAAAAVYDQAMSLLIFSLGLALLGGSPRKGLAEIVRAPVFWAIVVGAALGARGAALPGPIDSLCAGLGALAGPTALFVVAHDIGRIRVESWGGPAAAAALRIGGGAALAYAYAAAVGAEGAVRTALLLEGATPSAVLSYVLTARAGVPARFAAATLLVSTLASIVALPLWAAAVL